MSRIISGRLRLDVRSTSLPEVIDAAFGAVQLAADAKGVRLSRALDPRAGPIAGDPERLQQVIWNLLANAIKFTPKGGRVQTKLTHIDSHLEIEVSDSGQGIAADFLPHVFERFRQGEGTTTRRYSGLGLGLAIARHITELHGGTLEAASDGAGKGASFTLKLPLSAVRPAGTEPSREHPTAAAKPLLRDAPELTGFKVLVVDDEQDTRELLGAVLQGSRATVRTASSAAEALRLVDEEVPDVVVCDIGMPDEDGYALVTRLRERRAAQGRRIPAIAVTAFARAEDRTRALREGFDLHLAKPVEPAELIEAVASLARRARGA